MSGRKILDPTTYQYRTFCRYCCVTFRCRTTIKLSNTAICVGWHYHTVYRVHKCVNSLWGANASRLCRTVYKEHKCFCRCVNSLCRPIWVHCPSAPMSPGCVFLHTIWCYYSDVVQLTTESRCSLCLFWRLKSSLCKCLFSANFLSFIGKYIQPNGIRAPPSLFSRALWKHRKGRILVPIEDTSHLYIS